MDAGTVFLIVFGAVAGMFLFWGAIGFVACFVSLRKNSFAGKIINREFRKNYQIYKIDPKWWDQQEKEELQIEAEKVILKGVLIRNSSNKIALCVHGIFGVHEDLAPQAKIFFQNGFNVFAPDLRAHGKSTGKFIGMGFFEKSDILLWINKLIQIFGKDCSIVLCGISMGASSVLLCAKEQLPKNVKAIVSDSAYSNAYGEMEYLIEKKGHVPSFLILPPMNFFFKIFGKFDLKKVSPLNAVEKANVPILFFHGESDAFVPASNSKEMFEKSDKEKCKIFLTPNAKHIQSFAINEKGYAKMLLDFVNRLT